MFFMNSTYAAMAMLFIGLLYVYISYANPDKRSMAVIFQGVIFQFSRRLQIFLQKADKEEKTTWRPSVIAASNATFTRLGAFDLLALAEPEIRLRYLHPYHRRLPEPRYQ